VCPQPRNQNTNLINEYSSNLKVHLFLSKFNLVIELQLVVSGGHNRSVNVILHLIVTITLVSMSNSNQLCRFVQCLAVTITIDYDHENG